MVEARRYKMKQKSFNIYLDIDGVLLANELNLANHAQDFKVHINHLSRYYLLANYPLSRRCTRPFNALDIFDEETVTLMKRIKPTNWNINKTEAIDFETPFYGLMMIFWGRKRRFNETQHLR